MSTESTAGGAETTRMRRDAIRPGMVIRSSHGYRLLVSAVDDSAPSRVDARHVGITGFLHANPRNATCSERYPASSLIEVELPINVHDVDGLALKALEVYAAYCAQAMGESRTDEELLEWRTLYDATQQAVKERTAGLLAGASHAPIRIGTALVDIPAGSAVQLDAATGRLTLDGGPTDDDGTEVEWRIYDAEREEGSEFGSDEAAARRAFKIQQRRDSYPVELHSRQVGAWEVVE